MPINVVRGQTLTLLLEFFQAEEDGPPLNLTGATVSVHQSNYNATPLMAVTDAPNGQVTVVIQSAGTDRMSLNRPSWLQIKVVFPSGEVRVTPRIEMQAVT